MDIFISHIPGMGREAMLQQVLHRWMRVDCADRRIHILTPPRYISAYEFQMWRRVLAEERAHGPAYILADDDCLLHWGNDVDSLADTLLKTEFAILSVWPANATIQRWTPEDYKPVEDDKVMEHVSVGGIRFCQRLGRHKYGVSVPWVWPKQLGPGYDAEHCAALRFYGWRVGYFKNAKMDHLGEGQSTVWKEQQ